MKLHHVCAYASVVLWGASAIALWLIHNSPALPPELIMSELCNDAGDCSLNTDVVRLATQLGRLDFVSVGLTILGVGLGIAAITGYLAVREKAEITARATAREATEKWLKKEGQEILTQQFKLFADVYLTEVKMDDADQYADMWNDYQEHIQNQGDDNEHD